MNRVYSVLPLCAALLGAGFLSGCDTMGRITGHIQQFGAQIGRDQIGWKAEVAGCAHDPVIEGAHAVDGSGGTVGRASGTSPKAGARARGGRHRAATPPPPTSPQRTEQINNSTPQISHSSPRGAPTPALPEPRTRTARCQTSQRSSRVPNRDTQLSTPVRSPRRLAAVGVGPG